MMGRAAMRDTDPLPKLRTDVWRHAMADHWVEWPLWLMSDPDGHAYFTKFTDEKIKLTNYTNLRHELGLFPHPKRPVCAFTEEGKPIVRPGWRFPES
jgi:hypothetical protein